MKDDKLKEFVQNVESRTNDILEDSLMDEDAKEENFNVNYTETVKNSTKAKMSKLPWLIAIFLILIIAITLGFMFFKNNPKTLFTQTVDGLFTYLEDNVNENVYDVTDGNISLDYNIKSNDENANLYEKLSKVKFSADYVRDNAGERTYIDLKTTYDDNDFVSAKIYGDGSDTYVYSKDVYENYIKLSDNKLSYFINGNDIKIILKGLNQAIDKVIADEKIQGGKENLDIDGKVIKSYKMKFVIDKKNRNRVIETFVNTLKANDEFVSVLAKMKDVKNSDIKNSLDNYLLSLKEWFKEQDKLEVSLYVDNKTNDFIKVDFVSTFMNLNITQKDGNAFTYTFANNKEGTIDAGEFNVSVNENKTKYIYNISYKKTKGNDVLLEGNIDLKYTSKKASVFNDVDVSNSVDMSNISELEKIAIYTKILSTPNLSDFIPIIKKVV